MATVSHKDIPELKKATSPITKTASAMSDKMAAKSTPKGPTVDTKSSPTKGDSAVKSSATKAISPKANGEQPKLNRTPSNAEQKVVRSPTTGAQKLVRSPSNAEQPKIVRSPSNADQQKIVRSPSNADKPKIVRSPSNADQQKLVRSPSNVADKPKIVRSPSITDQQKIVRSPSITDQQKIVRSPSITDQQKIVRSPSNADQATVKIIVEAADQPKDEGGVIPAEKSSNDVSGEGINTKKGNEEMEKGKTLAKDETEGLKKEGSLGENIPTKERKISSGNFIQNLLCSKKTEANNNILKAEKANPGEFSEASAEQSCDRKELLSNVASGESIPSEDKKNEFDKQRMSDAASERGEDGSMDKPLLTETYIMSPNNTQDELRVSKATIRSKMWDHLEGHNLVMFPRPCTGRFPNFLGAHVAADKLIELPIFKNSKTILINADKPQEMVRYYTLEWGKRLLVPASRLRTAVVQAIVPAPNSNNYQLKMASQRYGIQRWGRPINFGDPIHIDLVVLGSVVVDKLGHRIGKGQGYMDIELAALIKMNAITDKTIIATTVHDHQVFETLQKELFTEHDMPVDWIITPTNVFEVENKLARPSGILWHLLSNRRLIEMPLLQKLREDDITAGQDCELKGEDTDVEEDAQPVYEQRYRSRSRRRFVNYNATGDPVRDSRMSLSRGSTSMDRGYQIMHRQPYRRDSSRRSSMSQYRYGAGDNRDVRGRYGGRYNSQMFDGRYGYGNRNSMPQRRYSERGWSMSEYSDSDYPYRGSRSVTPRRRNHSHQWNKNMGPREERMGPREGRMGPRDDRMGPRDDRMEGENMPKRTPRRKSSRKDSPVERSEGAISPQPSSNRRRNRRKSSAVEKPAEDTSSSQSYGRRRRSQSTNGRRRNGKEVAFTLRIRNIQAGVRVRDLKEALQQRGIRPKDITWRGFRGFAFLHFPKLMDGKEVEQETVIRSLQGLLVKPKIEKEEDLFCVVEAAKPKPTAEVSAQ